MTALKRIQTYLVKIFALIALIFTAFFIIFRYGLHKDQTNPKNTRHVQYFCTRLCRALNIQVHVHGAVPEQTALWVSNHISFLDIPVLGSVARLFFLSKAEIAQWPVVGFLARCGGTLFIQRGSGDANKVGQQMANYLRQDIPLVFFPEATTTNGHQIKKIYGKLLSAAIETQRPLQIALLCYVNADGQLDSTVPFVDIDFAQHAKQVLALDDMVHAHVLILPAMSVEGYDIKTLTAIVQQKMEQGLAELHQQVLKVH
ncbi:MAG: lysophospholipid acyltransferase family protein [Acinetobacter sp.]|nr:lysophospholipid acyltransferase family protein [Acinetobacter sp.]